MALIDREELASLFREKANDYPHFSESRRLLNFGALLTESMEEVNPEDLRVKGKWVMRGGKRYCSHCKERACVTRDMEDFWYCEPTNYCPNCGAKMEE